MSYIRGVIFPITYNYWFKYHYTQLYSPTFVRILIRVIPLHNNIEHPLLFLLHFNSHVYPQQLLTSDVISSKKDSSPVPFTHVSAAGGVFRVLGDIAWSGD